MIIQAAYHAARAMELNRLDTLSNADMAKLQISSTGSTLVLHPLDSPAPAPGNGTTRLYAQSEQLLIPAMNFTRAAISLTYVWLCAARRSSSGSLHHGSAPPSPVGTLHGVWCYRRGVFAVRVVDCCVDRHSEQILICLMCLSGDSLLPLSWSNE